ncbi:sensor domain-containing diguanylate cyclase [Fundidesulfovibrio agrisoli]|uniref:sensor domain-containing diguanylate cyclase n=1 Tax=Fundidesulfovibrio agrisoli TaxID=2922717 RepID=UPI001FABD60D|nr:sensor domain-containing diguanylate cyclase [Fundidesulfovibrio agrisoli]
MASQAESRPRRASPKQRLEAMEQAYCLTMEALELATAMGVGATPRSMHNPAQVLADSAQRVRGLVPMKALAYYLIREPGGGFNLAKCWPPSRRRFFEREMAHLAETGSAPWALHRDGPVFTTPKSGKGELFVHTLSTPSRIRGILLGLLDQEVKTIQDAPLKLVTIVLRNTAALLESVELYSLWRSANAQLKDRVRDLERSRRSLRREIERRRAVEEQLKHQTLHDALTGLPNRTLIRDRIMQAIRRGMRRNRNQENAAFCVAFMDLDRFKLVNDHLGHAAGDALLVETGRRVQEGLRELDTVARIGGDEFVILLEDLTSPGEAVRIIKRVRANLGESLDLEGFSLGISASFGLAFGPSSLSTPEELIEQADVAMQAAKQAGRDRIRVYCKALRALERSRTTHVARLRSALHAGRTTALFVPTFAAQGPNLTGFEAVPAWDDGQGGFIYGKQLWNLAKHSSLEWELWERTLSEGLAQLATWREESGCGGLALTMHLGRSLVPRSGIPDAVEETLQNLGLPGSALRLEVPEHSLLESTERLTEQLRRLKKFGVRLCVGDFGERFFSFLGQHPELIDSMRIDPCVEDAASPEADQEVKAACLRKVADSLGLEAQEHTLSREAVLGPQGPLGQGALDGSLRPLTAQEALEMVRRVRSRGSHGYAGF